MSASLSSIHKQVLQCRRCPELRDYCADIGRIKRKAFADWDYHAKPVTGFGDPEAWLWIVGLAPAAHGANRTGRMFTGDRSGDFLYAGLHRAGLANQPNATARDDGLELRGVYISAALRCAPPANKPTQHQLQQCRSYLMDERNALTEVQVLLALGGIAWNTILQFLSESGLDIPKPRPKFGHGAEIPIGPYAVIGCYHVSQQNTFTGRLTESMFDSILTRAHEIAQRGLHS